MLAATIYEFCFQNYKVLIWAKSGNVATFAPRNLLQRLRVYALGDRKQTDNDFVLHRTSYKSFYKSSNLFAGLEYSIKSGFTKSKFVLFGDTLYLLKKVSTPNADHAAENETQLYTLNQIVHYV